MVDINILTDIAMKIVAYAGTAKSNYILALKHAKKGDFYKCNESIQLGDESYRLAHNAHMDILTLEASTLEPQVSVLLMHAEDQLMNGETIKFIVLEFIELIKKEGEFSHV